jgi:molecular chaperone DnaK (HSP70)
MPKFQKCVKITAQVILEAKVNKGDIDDIVLIGGSTKIPKIQQLLTEFFNGKALNSQIKADEAVAVGAAIQAALLYGKFDEVSKNVSVSNVTPLSLGIKNSKGNMVVAIPKNTPVPCSKTETWFTKKDWQTTMWFPIFEGESLVAEDNTMLGKFRLTNIPSARARKERTEVTVTIDDEGILHVKAVCCSNGSSNDITIDAYRGRMASNKIAAAKDSAKSLTW